LEKFIGRAQGVTVRFRMSSEEKARDASRGRAPSDLGAFTGQGAFAMHDSLLKLAFSLGTFKSFSYFSIAQIDVVHWLWSFTL